MNPSLITYYILIDIVQERVQRLLSEGWLNAHDCKVGILKIQKYFIAIHLYSNKIKEQEKHQLPICDWFLAW